MNTHLTRSIVSALALVTVSIAVIAQEHSSIDKAKDTFPKLRIPVIDGDIRLVYEPDPDHPNSWMINDHCLIRDEKGLIHFFGIENPFPTTTQALEWLKADLQPSERPFIQTLHRLMHGHLYRNGTHFRIGHAVATNIWGPWRRLPAALDGGDRKTGHGSPFVVRYENKYWMLEPGGRTGIYMSANLTEWTPVNDATRWGDKTVFCPSGHRDPCIIQLKDGTFLQCFAGDDPDGRNTVRLASSKDLKTWHAEKPCYVERIPNAPFSGIFESPFVFCRDGLYYLFVGFSHRHYYETFVVVSSDPRQFMPQNKITTLFTHAAEFIELAGETYMSSCGIEDPQCLNRSGLWICKIRWLRP